MVSPSHYSLLRDDRIPEAWFEAQRTRYDIGNDTLKDTFLFPEITTLKDFHYGVLSTKQAAHDITRPISENPVPSLNTYSDDIVAVTHLWRLYKDALVEWPSSLTPDLIQLGIAISEIPDKLHKGEALNDEEPPQSLMWKDLPYIHMVWRDAHWQQPSDLVEECKNDGERAHARDTYLKQQDVAAQLVAAGILDYSLALQAVVSALEKAKSDQQGGENGAVAKDDVAGGDFEQLVLDFHIPAAACWIKHNGQRMRASIVEKGLDDVGEEKKKNVLRGARLFDQPADRWTYWKDRLELVAREASDDFVREEANAAVDVMKAISG